MSDFTPPGIPPVPEEIPYSPATPNYLPPPPSGGVDRAANDKTVGMLCHLLALSGYIGIPFGNIVGPLIIWLTQKDKSAFADYHGKESLNFQISVIIAVAICVPLILLLGLGILLMMVVGVYAFVMTIIAAVKANEGVLYRYPYTLRLIK